MRPPIQFALLGALVLVAGCGGQAPPMASSTRQSYDFTSEGTFPRTPEVEGKPTSAFTQDAAVIPSRTGWSVQVFAGRSKDVASRMQDQLQSAVSEKVYVDYVEPYYKVRVGDCEEREECDALQRRLRGLGSASAWVVPRTIQGALQP